MASFELVAVAEAEPVEDPEAEVVCVTEGLAESDTVAEGVDVADRGAEADAELEAVGEVEALAVALLLSNALGDGKRPLAELVAEDDVEATAEAAPLEDADDEGEALGTASAVTVGEAEAAPVSVEDIDGGGVKSELEEGSAEGLAVRDDSGDLVALGVWTV